MLNFRNTYVRPFLIWPAYLLFLEFRIQPIFSLWPPFFEFWINIDRGIIVSSYLVYYFYSLLTFPPEVAVFTDSQGVTCDYCYGWRCFCFSLLMKWWEVVVTKVTRIITRIILVKITRKNKGKWECVNPSPLELYPEVFSPRCD